MKTPHRTSLQPSVAQSTVAPRAVRYVALGAFITALIAAAAFAAYRSEARRFDDNVLEATRSAVAILRAQTDTTFDKIAVGLNAVVYSHSEQTRHHGRVDPRELKEVLIEQRRLLPEVDFLRILDAEGIVRYSNEDLPTTTTSQADRPFYTGHRDSAQPTMLVTGPFFGRIAKRWVINFSRRLQTPDGRFAGVVFAGVDLDHFASAFSLGDLGPRDVVVMRRINGDLLWRYPSGGDIAASISRDSEAVRRRVNEATDGHYLVVSPVDGVERIYVFQRLAHYPFYLFVGRSVDAIRAEFHRSALIGAVAALLLIAMSLTGVGLAYRAARVRAQAARRVADSEERLAYALDATSEGVWDWHIPTNESYCTGHYFDMLGYRSEDFANTADSHLLDLMHPEDKENLLPRLAGLLARDGHYAVEFRLRAANGDYKWILSRGKVVERDANGAPVRAIGTHTDISARKAAEARLRDYQRQLEERNHQVEALNAALTRRAVEAESAVRAKELFLAKIGHELRTPLTPIVGFVDLLIRRITDPVQSGWLQSIRRSALELLRVIDDMLDLISIESGRLAVDNVVFRLGSVLDEVRHATAEEARDKGLAFEISVAPGIPDELRGDPKRLRQILQVFAGNAVKFTEHGTIALTVHAVPGNRTTPTLRFEVKDTGIGIPPDVQARLFTPFAQGDDSLSRQYGGLGLGLAIARQLAPLMGGEVGCDSVPGKGSTFWLTVPFAAVAAATVAVTDTDSLLTRLEALLAADDSFANRWFAEAQTALESHYGREALAGLKEAIARFDYPAALAAARALHTPAAAPPNS